MLVSRAYACATKRRATVGGSVVDQPSKLSGSECVFCGFREFGGTAFTIEKLAFMQVAGVSQDRLSNFQCKKFNSFKLSILFCNFLEKGNKLFVPR